MQSLLIKTVFLLLLTAETFAQRDHLPPNLLVNCTVRIEAYKDTMINGKKKWKSSIGTGFFYEFFVDTIKFTAIVTNKHVVENSTYGRLTFKEQNRSVSATQKNSFIINIKDFYKKWIDHPNEDLSILPFKPIKEQFKQEYNKEIEYTWFTEDLIPKTSDSLKISSIEKVLMIGYPKALWDSINNFPIIRQGLTATPFFSDFNNQKRFLIDIPTFNGSSGSPVLLYSTDPYWKDTNTLMTEYRAFLLGIVVESYNYDAEGRIITENKDNQVEDSLKIERNYKTEVTLPFNIAIVIKSERLSDFIPLIKSKLNIENHKKNNPQSN